MLVSSADDIIRIRGYIRHLIRNKTKSGISTSEAIKSLVQNGDLHDHRPKQIVQPAKVIYIEKNFDRDSLRNSRYGNDYDSNTFSSHSEEGTDINFCQKSVRKNVISKGKQKSKKEIIALLKNYSFQNSLVQSDYDDLVKMERFKEDLQEVCEYGVDYNSTGYSLYE